MRTRLGWLAAVCVLTSATTARGQVVQLPSFELFTVNTTVSVPDQGSMLLGGTSSSFTGRDSRGVPGLSKLPGAGRLFTNKAIGSETSAAGLRVSATIHDQHEMDAAVLASAGRSSETIFGSSATDRTASFLSAHVARTSSRTTAPPTASTASASVAEIRQQNAAAKERLEQEASDLFEQGQQAEVSGKRNVAKIYYQMATRRSTGAVKEQAAARLAELSSPSAKIIGSANGRGNQ